MCDVSVDDHRIAVERLLVQYGFKKIMSDLFENTAMSETAIARLKRDIDGVTDSYDAVRMYQYPMRDTLVITSLNEKKWRRLVIRPDGR